MEFHFHKERKRERLIALCEQAGYSWRLAGDKVMVSGALQKKAGAYMLNWTKKAIADFVDEYKYWDGHESATAVSIHCVDKEQLDWVQTLGRLVGVGGNFQKPKTSGFGSTIHTLQQNNRQYATARLIKVRTRDVENLMVYCPTVSTGAFLVRHNGKISVTGNTNYYGKPPTMAKHLKVLVTLIEQFQKKYLLAFPGFKDWWHDVAFKLQTTGSITTFLARERTFFGRADDDSTLREAIAYEPQSVVGDIVNEGGYRLWKHIPEWQPLVQIHDAWLGQIPHKDLDRLIPQILNLFQIPISHPNTTRTMTIPAEAKVGFNWGDYNNGDNIKKPQNLDGLKKWKGSDDRQRTEWANQNLLDRVIHARI